MLGRASSRWGRTASGGVLVSETRDTGADGAFALRVPPGADHYDILVRPGSNVGVPTQTFTNIAAIAGVLGDLVLDVSAPVTVPVNVTDASGAAAADTTLQRSALSAIAIRHGQRHRRDRREWPSAAQPARWGVHLLATPRTSAMSGLAETHITVGKEAPLTPVSLVVPAKAAVDGVVRNASAAAVGNARVHIQAARFAE